MAAVRAVLRIQGRVQGVGYRYAAQRQAMRLGLRGRVRNLDDGSVELVVEGDEANVERLIAWCRVGPPAASVERVDVTRAPATGEFGGFEVD
jgi:acylphosphatase